MKKALLFAAMAVVAASIGASASAQDKGRLVIGVTLEPPHLDPTAGAAAAIDEIVYANLFEGLTRIDRTGAVVPGLAERWTVSGDGLVYTFHLRRGVTFHDGTGFDAEDVKFSLDRARAADSTNAQKGFFEPIAAVETPDPHTVVVRLSRPDGQFLFNMGSGDASIVASQSADTNKRQPIGTGPFRFERWVPGDRIVLVKNPDFRDPALPMLDEVTFRVIADPAAQAAAMLAGDIDAFTNFGATEALPAFERDPRFAVVIGTTEGETMVAMNNGRPPFDDLKVRQAVSLAIDRQQVIDGAMFGYGTPIGSHFAPHRAGYVDLTGLYPHDPERAKALLAEAGYPDGFETTLKLPPPVYARRGGEIVAAQLAEVGIRARIEPIEWAQWLEQVFGAKDYDLTVISHTEPLDIDIYDRDDYYFNYRSDRFHAVMEELDRTIEPEARARLYEDAQRILAEDAVNGFLFQLAKIGVRRADLIGLWENSPIQANDVTTVHWK